MIVAALETTSVAATKKGAKQLQLVWNAERGTFDSDLKTCHQSIEIPNDERESKDQWQGLRTLCRAVGLDVVASKVKTRGKLRVCHGGDELEKIAKALRGGRAEIDFDGETTIYRKAPDAKKTAPLEWSDPVSFDDTGDLPPFPDDALPPVLRDWSRANAIDLRVPVELPALMSLACIATASAKCIRIELKPGWEEPLNVFLAIALRSGETKSPTLRRAIRPIQGHEKRMRDQHRGALRELRARVAAARKKEARERAQVELEDLEKQGPPQLLVDDCTPEALAVTLARQHERMGLLSAEGGIFDTIAGRYANKIPNIDLFNKAYSGDSIRVDRVTRGTISLDEPALTVGLCVQPHVIQELAAKPGFRGTGFLARFLYALPRSMVGMRVADPPPVPPEIDRAYDEMLTTLLALRPTSDTPRLRLSTGANELRSKFQMELEPRLAEFGDLGPIADWGNKLVGNIARLAGLLHLAAHPRLFGNIGNTDGKQKQTGATPKNQAKKGFGNIGNRRETFVPCEISAHTFADAIKLGEYFLHHALAAFSLMGADPIASNAKHVLGWVQRERHEAFEHRTLQQGVKGTIKRVEDLDAALSLLVDHGYLKDVPKPRTHGRPPKPSYAVNPACHNSHNSQKGNVPPEAQAAE